MISDIDFPPDLPCVSRIDGYSFNSSSSLYRTDFDAGNARQRRSNFVLPQEFTLSWRCPNDKLHPLFTWLNAYGYNWFNLRLASIESSELGQFASDIVVRLMTDISISLNPIYKQQWWTLSVGAEYWPPESMLVGGSWVIGRTPGDPSPDWVVGRGPPDPPLSRVIGGTPELPS